MGKRVLAVLGRWWTDIEFESVVNTILSVFRPPKDRKAAMSSGWNSASTRGADRHRLRPVHDAGPAVDCLAKTSWRTHGGRAAAEAAARRGGALCRLVGQGSGVWKLLKGMDNNWLALSNHVAEVFSVWGGESVVLVPDFDRLYDTWEIATAIAFTEQYTRAQLGADQTQLIPLGRFAAFHRRDVVARVLTNALAEELLEAGLAGGNMETLLLVAAQLAKRRW